MADSQDTVTIRAEMISDIPEEAAKSAEAVKGMSASMRSATEDASTSAGRLGKTIDDIGSRSEKVASGGASHLSKKMHEVEEQGRKARESLSSLGEAVTERLQYPLQQLSYALEAGAVGIVAWGLATNSTLQQTSLQLAAFTGNAAAGTAAMTALMQLRDPANLSTLTGSYETLVNGGASSTSALALTKALAGAGAVSGGNSAGVLASGSSALANILSTGGLMTAGDVQSLQKIFPQLFGILGSDTGQSAAAVRTGAARGESWQLPANLLSQLEATPQARNGLSDYGKTFEGELGRAKTSLGGLLAMVEQPLGNALGNAANKIDAWAGGVEGRFKTMSTTLGRELSSGNTSGFGSSLATVLGDPKLAGGISTVTKDAEDFARIMTGSVIPAARDVGKVAVPALDALSKVLDVMAAHKSATEGVILTIGGLVVLTKLAQAAQTASKAMTIFQDVMEEQGPLKAILGLTRGLEGLKSAQEAVAGASKAAAAAEGGGGLAAAAGEGGADVAGVGLTGLAGAGAGTGALIGAGAALVGYGLYTGLHPSSINKYAARDTLTGPTPQSLAGLNSPGFQGLNFTGPVKVDVTIPGAGNPEKVANAIPKGINAQVGAYAARTARRSGRT